MATPVSILSPYPYHAATCGYCSLPGQRSRTESYYSIGADAHVLTCDTYQRMIDRGWRRSGTYCYKPDNKRTCCPQYPIRLEALKFAPTRSQRKVLYRWNRYVLEGDSDEDDPMEGSKSKKSKKTPPFSLVESVHDSEASFCAEVNPPKHRFEVSLEPSSFTDEKFALFRKYQGAIHNDPRDSPSSFESFLVNSPLTDEPISYTKEPPIYLPQNYGSYHMLYRLDGDLMAMAVLDILPNCVSSVYFMYDNRWEQYSMGKLSAMREIALTQEIHDHGVPDMKYLYLGYYIHSCPKMRYKADYSPSFLLDPLSFTWHAYKDIIPILDSNHFACFADPALSSKDVEKSERDVRQLTEDEGAQIRVFERSAGLQAFLKSRYWRSAHYRTLLYEVGEALGTEITNSVIFVPT